MILPLDFGRITSFIAFCQLAWMPKAWKHSSNRMGENRSWFSFSSLFIAVCTCYTYSFYSHSYHPKLLPVPSLQYLPGCMYDFRLEHIKLGMRMIKLTCSDKYGSVKVHGWLPSSLYFVEWVNSSNQAYILPLWYNSHCCEVCVHVLWPHHRHKYRCPAGVLWRGCPLLKVHYADAI